ncbi:MAG TPA: RecX family transcriptional regulator [Chitinophagales bacterium]|nr:RecX family transcriptional regulator [Chitinophagales bacterium]
MEQTIDIEIYNKLTNYCAYQERCATDVKDKLRKLKVEKGDYDAYIEKLRAGNFLNDDRYVKYFVAGHAKKKWGKTKMKAALNAKRIDASIIKMYLDDMDEEDYDDQIKAAAEKKWNSIRTGTPREKKTKVLRFLLSKGYEMKKATEAMKILE